MLELVVDNTDKVKDKKKLKGFFFPDTVYHSEILTYFTQSPLFMPWFKIASNAIRSDKLKMPLCKQIYEELYLKKGLLAVFYSNKSLCRMLGLAKRTIRKMKKDLVDGGFVKIEKLSVGGREFDCFVVGEVKEYGEFLYGLDVCVPGYRKMERKCFYFWPSYAIHDPDFIKFLGAPEFPLWFFYTANVMRGKFRARLPNMIRQEFYDNGNKLPAYYPDKFIAERLGMTTRRIQDLRASLVEKGIIEVEKRVYSKHFRPVVIVGKRVEVDGKLIERITLFEKMRPKEESVESSNDFFSSDFEFEKFSVKN
jgi:hypothetical protein